MLGCYILTNEQGSDYSLEHWYDQSLIGMTIRVGRGPRGSGEWGVDARMRDIRSLRVASSGKRQWRTWTIVGLLIALLIPACGGNDETSATNDKAPQDEVDITISTVFYTREIPYYQEMAEGMEDAAAELGVTVQIRHADFDVTRQIDLVENAIVSQPDAIIIAPIDRAALLPSAQQAHAADIPVVLVGDELGPGGEEFVLTYVGQIFHDLGVLKAEWLAEALGGEGKVLVVHGPRGLDYVEAQSEGYEEVFANYPDIELVEGSYGDFSSEHGLTTSQNLLTSHPDADAIWFDNDDLAIGGIRAIGERNIDYDDILTVSSDGTMVGWEAVKRGELDATVTIRPYLVGFTSIEVLHAYLTEGTKPPYPVNVEMFPVEESNANDLEWEDIR